jgi:hypothetical protein
MHGAAGLTIHYIFSHGTLLREKNKTKYKKRSTPDKKLFKSKRKE